MAVDLAGSLALVAMLALSSTGVTVTRAEAGDVAGLAEAVPPEADACRVPPRQPGRVPAALLERLRQEMASGDGEVVVLNNRGYGYRSPRDPAAALALIEAEARRQAERR